MNSMPSITIWPAAFVMMLLIGACAIVEAARYSKAVHVSAPSVTSHKAAADLVHPNDMSYVSSQCRGGSFLPWSTYGIHVAQVMGQLVDSTPYSDGYQYKTRTPGSNAPAFGFAGCAPRLTSEDDCQACLTQAANDLLSLCNYAISARLRYQDCWLRYDNHYFNNGMTGN